MIKSNDRYTQPICFRSLAISAIDTLENLYHTTYTITLDKGREVYDIHFYFYKEKDSISIFYFNQLNNYKITVPITFNNHCSKRMFKNYKINDTTIQEDDKYCTLFTVADTSRPFITLNRFQLPDDKNTFLVLDTINVEKLRMHVFEAKNYFAFNESMLNDNDIPDRGVVNSKKEIDSTIKDMQAYKARIIHDIVVKDSLFELTGTPQEATETNSESFTKKVDAVFFDYCKKTCPFENFEAKIQMTFICNGYGRLDTTRTSIDSTNAFKIRWLIDSFKARIQPFIQGFTYRTRTSVINYPDLISDFNKMPFNDIGANNAEHQIFTNAKTKIRNDLDQYSSREVNIPTKYTYLIKYKSTVTFSEWIYTSYNGREILSSKNYNEVISDELKDIFKSKIAKAGIGNYKVEICNVFFNYKLVGQDVRKN